MSHEYVEWYNIRGFLLFVQTILVEFKHTLNQKSGAYSTIATDCLLEY